MGHKELVLADEPQAVIDGLSEALDRPAILLFDEQEALAHASMSRDWWFSHPGDVADLADPANLKGVCVVQARINDRWILHVHRRPSLHPDARHLVEWAAAKVAPFLARRTKDDPAFSPPRGSGGSGPAELGIPVTWTRRRPS